MMRSVFANKNSFGYEFIYHFLLGLLSTNILLWFVDFFLSLPVYYNN